MSNEILSRVGERVRKFRKQKGWTLEELSKESGLHQSSISQIERGQRNLTLKNLNRLSEGLDVDPYQLLLFVDGKIMDSKQSERFKIQEMLETAPEEKKELMYNLSRILMEWHEGPTEN